VFRHVGWSQPLFHSKPAPMSSYFSPPYYRGQPAPPRPFWAGHHWPPPPPPHSIDLFGNIMGSHPHAQPPPAVPNTRHCYYPSTMPIQQHWTTPQPANPVPTCALLGPHNTNYLVPKRAPLIWIFDSLRHLIGLQPFRPNTLTLFIITLSWPILRFTHTFIQLLVIAMEIVGVSYHLSYLHTPTLVYTLPLWHLI